MKSILLIGNHLSRHGVNPNVCEELAARLEAQGRCVITASAIRWAPARAADILQSIWRRRRDYDAAQIDVFSGRAFLWAEAAGHALASLGKPFVLTLHGGNFPRFLARHPRRTAWLIRRATAVTAPSEYLARVFRPLRPDIEILPNAIEAAATRLPPPSPRLVWMRALSQVYDPGTAVRSLAAIGTSHAGADLTLYGPVRCARTLEKTKALTQTLGLSGRVNFAGRVPKAQVPATLAQGGIFLNTSLIDNTPVSVIEAMAAGLPIISSSVGGIPDLLRDGIDALLTPPGDPEAMAGAIRRCYDSPELAQSLARKARDRAVDFEWSQVLPKWERLLDSLPSRLSK